MRLQINVSLQCEGCGYEEGHGPFCPKPLIDRLEREVLHLPCPSCRAQEVDRNDLGLMECRACASQYRRAILPAEREKMLTDHWVIFHVLTDLEGPVVYFPIPAAGFGRFAKDQLLEKTRAKFEELKVLRETVIH